jgi:hypothetical protein
MRAEYPETLPSAGGYQVTLQVVDSLDLVTSDTMYLDILDG